MTSEEQQTRKKKTEKQNTIKTNMRIHIKIPCLTDSWRPSIAHTITIPSPPWETHPPPLHLSQWDETGSNSLSLPTVRHKATLNKNIVSGPAAGCVYYCRMGTLFSHFAQKNFFCHNFIIFLPKEKKGKKINFAAPWLATMLATR